MRYSTLLWGTLLICAIAPVAQGQEDWTVPVPLPTVEPEPADSEADQASAQAAQQAAVAAQLKEVSKHITVVTATPNVRIVVGGAIVADFLFNEARPIGPGTPFFLTPGSAFGFDQDTFDANARQTNLFFLVSGPKVCDWDTGGMILANLYNDAVINDRYGFLPLQAWGHVKNDYWRYAAGFQFDIFNPLNPTMLPFSYLLASGNTGDFRGQARVERFVYLSDESQVTLTGGISEPIPTSITDDFTLSEDNGWPNVEGRVVLGLGPSTGEGLLARRPFEVGVSGVVGQIRTTQLAFREVADVWGLGVDLRWGITERVGFQGEYYVGETLGTYGGAVLQNINTTTFAGIDSMGWWAEVYYYWCPDRLHTHIGYGMDDPRNADLAPNQIEWNETVFANLIWDVNKYLRFATELTYRKTDWMTLLDNEGMGVHFQTQLRF